MCTNFPSLQIHPRSSIHTFPRKHRFIPVLNVRRIALSLV